MKRHNTGAAGFLLALALILSIAVPSSAAADPDALAQAADGSCAYLLETVKSPQVGSIGGEWAVIGLARSGYDVPQSYWDNYYATVEAYVKACQGNLHDKKYTQYSRVAVALCAIGADPANVGGYNLLTAFGDFEKTVWQGVNGPIWALIALDAGGYDIPVNPNAKTQATRQMYVDEILSRQLENGGWNLTDRGGDADADPDVTAMALQALAGYQSQGAVKAATEKALTCLSMLQDPDGGYTSWGAANAESCAQVILALCALGIDLGDSRFVKNGHTLLDSLLRFRQPDGSFLHTASGSGSSQMASEQGLLAMAAALRAREGKSSLYRMDDVAIRPSGSLAAGLPGKHTDVRKLPVAAPGATFPDISGANAHKNQTAIEALASRGVINGKSSGLFDPNASMTRAEFAAIVTRGLGLSSVPGGVSHFRDVAQSKWYHDPVETACAYGIVTGVGGGNFNPDGTITRQEAAVMAARAAGLCGMDTQLSASAIRDTLAQFSDYTAVADWAGGAAAFCFRANIFDPSALEIQPGKAILRCEVAQMLYNILCGANLI